MIKELFLTDSQEDPNNYYQAMRAWKIDPNQEFIKVKGRIGFWPSQTYAQMFFAESRLYKKLRRELELHQRESNPANHDHDVVIVLPPQKALSKTSIQQFLRQSMGLCTVGQFAFVSHAQVNSDRVISGAKSLSRIISEKRKSGRKLLIVSYSYGSAFVRVMLDRLTPEERAPIKGWLNISGLIFGSPRFHCSDRFSLINSTSSWQRSFSSEQNYLTAPLNTYGIKTVHFLGVKGGANLSYREKKKRESLKAWGPNDGVVSFSPYQRLDQPVLPLFDQGHEVDLRPLASTFVRTLSSMVSTLPLKSKVGFDASTLNPQLNFL